MKKGFSLIELLVTIMIIVVVTTTVAFFMYPVKQKQKSRDFVRVGNLHTIARALEEYNLDNGSLPDTDNVLRTSNTLPTGSTGPLDSISQGWIKGNFTKYLQELPIDPKNDSTYYYSFMKNGNRYELDAKLEIDTSDMQNDHGNNANLYEVGSDLTLIN